MFGLVGESGCGKTTTGRSVIKLYKITSGNVWFKNARIAAGTRKLEEALHAARKEGRRRAAELQKTGRRRGAPKPHAAKPRRK